MTNTGSTIENKPALAAPSHRQQVEPCECGGKPLGISCDPRCPASGEQHPVNPAHLAECDAEYLNLRSH